VGEQGHRPARADLRAEFPGMRGLSQCSLVYMRTFAAAWGGPITRQVVAQLPWGHITLAPGESDLAREIVHDPYDLDFLALDPGTPSGSWKTPWSPG